MVKKSRRKFIWLVNTAIAAILLFIWNKLTINHIDLSTQKEKIIPLEKNKQITFFEDYIVINQKEKTTVLLAKCTHLGCKINSIENGKLICPCHGSEYDMEGTPVKGPAFQNLKKVPHKLSSDGLTLEIES
jgi:cytochrome b6-f complex iron-sulfur subunit